MARKIELLFRATHSDGTVTEHKVRSIPVGPMTFPGPTDQVGKDKEFKQQIREEVKDLKGLLNDEDYKLEHRHDW